jgi:hypothetical protein
MLAAEAWELYKVVLELLQILSFNLELNPFPLSLSNPGWS